MPLPILRALLLVAALAPVAAAQGYPASQRGSVTQNVAFTEISITYGRPVARGRTLFGQLVRWDNIWHPGADSATRVVFSRDVLLEGQEVKAGEYSVWLIPHEKAPWTFILNRSAHVYHNRYPGPGTDALRVDIAPDTASHMESLAFYFAMVDKEDAELRFHWGETILPIHIKAPNRP